MRVAVTGAAGRIGRVVHPGLAMLGHDVVAMDIVSADGVESLDIGDTATLASSLRGCEAVVHLAANASETSFDGALYSHLRLTHSVLEAMRTAGVPRLVYASSNHAVGFTPRTELVSVHTRVRPDTFYGFGKSAAEALCSLYTDRYGIATACLRIGGFAERPGNRRQLAIWLSPGDAVRLVEACLTAPDLTFAIVYGISANSRGWWDLEPARALGYRPQDDAEDFAAEVLARPESADDRFAALHVGGEFCRPGWVG
jgi:uronate dehydrogenase